MSNIYLLIDANNIIVDRIVWDGDVANWTPPAELTAVMYEGSASSGWLWDGTQAIDPNPPQAPPPMPEITRKVDDGPENIA